MGGAGGVFTSGYDTADVVEFIAVNAKLRPQLHAAWADGANEHLEGKRYVGPFTEAFASALRFLSLSFPPSHPPPVFAAPRTCSLRT